MKHKFKLTYLLLFLCLCGFGQIKEYNYKRELTGIKDQWHKIILPNEIFEKVWYDLRDIRIFSISKNNDTLEIPYILKGENEKKFEKEVAFNLINQSKNVKGYYFTFELHDEQPINQIKLEFKQQNFDWKLKLEGSQNQQEWFSIIENYRILSIKNKLTDYKFTNLTFPNSKYRFFRLFVNSEKKPELITAKILLNQNNVGNFRKYSINSTKTTESKQNKQIIIDIDLNSRVPVSNLKFFLKDKFDYYRPLTIQYLSDSFKTDYGWKYFYKTLTSGTLNSINKNEFNFECTILKKLKIIIVNYDDKPLTIDSLQVEGYVHELIARFNDPADYYLAYGKIHSEMPNYDISRFLDKIPTTLTALELGEEQKIEKDPIKKINPLFENKIWLWIIMAIIIILLGWFSVKMMRQK